MLFKCPLCHSEKLNEVAIGVRPDHYFLCSICEYKFLNPAMRLDENSEKNRYLLHQNDVDNKDYQNFVQPLFEQICAQVHPPAHGLDFGAGTGPVLAKMLQKQGYQVSLYDPFFWPDRSVLSGKYDFIFACEVVEHLYEPAHEFAQLRGMLEKNGLLALMTHLYNPAVSFEKWYYRLDPTHVGFFNAQTFQWIKEHYGFSHLKIVGERIALLIV